MAISIRRYDSSCFNDWGSVLKNSRNGIFIFDRRFIEYHGDRFVDFSAIVYIDDEPVALLPASIDSGRVVSHAGLTFGGIVLKRSLRSDVAIDIVEALFNEIKLWGAETLTIKLLPSYFECYPSSEISYALWRKGLTLIRKDLSSILPLIGSLPFNSSKIQSVKKAKNNGITVGIVPCYLFYELLNSVLLTQHSVSPVHSLGDLELLMGLFPEKIFIRAALKNNELMAAALIFNYGHVWHTQYLASSTVGRTLGALDLVLDEVIDEARKLGVSYLSFGSSTENNGEYLNKGLIWQKESYGARSVTHDYMSGTV